MAVNQPRLRRIRCRNDKAMRHSWMSNKQHVRDPIPVRTISASMCAFGPAIKSFMLPVTSISARIANAVSRTPKSSLSCIGGTPPPRTAKGGREPAASATFPAAFAKLRGKPNSHWRTACNVSSIGSDMRETNGPGLQWPAIALSTSIWQLVPSLPRADARKLATHTLTSRMARSTADQSPRPGTSTVSRMALARCGSVAVRRSCALPPRVVQVRCGHLCCARGQTNYP